MPNNSILLIEDNPSDVALTKRALTKAGIANPLAVAEDGREALDYLFAKGKFEGRNTSDLPTLVLLDLKLPVIDGLEVLKQIKAHPLTRRLLVIILTTSKELQDIAKGYDLGVNSYITKPVDFNHFAETIKQVGLYWLTINEIPPLVN